MARKTKSRVLAEPSEATGWNVWHFSETGENALRHRDSAFGTVDALKPDVWGIPAKDLIVVPMWLNDAPAETHRDMVGLQLEMKGFSEVNSSTMDFRVVREREGRSLFLAMILAPLSEVQGATSGRVYTPSAWMRRYAEDSLTLWKEQETLILTATCGSNIVHTQPLTMTSPGTELEAEVISIALGLQAEGIVDELRIFESWLPSSCGASGWVHSLADRLGLACVEKERPAPVESPIPWNLTPGNVLMQRRRQAKSGQTYKWLSVLATLYLLSVLVMGTLLGWKYYRLSTLRAEYDQNSPQATAIRETASRWMSMEAALDPARFPLEVLHQVVSRIPLDGVRILRFSIEQGKIEIKAEAVDVPLSYLFFEGLQQAPGLSGYKWSMQPPRFQNEKAVFQITAQPYAQAQ